LTGEEV